MAARADRTRVLAVAPVVADLVVVHRAWRIVHRTGSHAEEEASDVIVAHVLVLLAPLHVLKPVDALEVEDVRVSALEPDGAICAVVVDDHLVLRARNRELLEKYRNIRVGAIHEVDLEALRAELREVFGDFLLLAVDLRPRHPQDDTDALLVCVVDKVRNIHVRTVLPDVEFSAPALVEDDVFNAVLRRKVDEALVGLRVAASAVVEGVPPIPCDLARLHPREICALRRRRRERVRYVGLAELGRRVGEREYAPGKRTRRIGLRNEIFAFLNGNPPTAIRDDLALAPSTVIGGMGSRLWILSKERLELGADFRLLNVAEVPDGIVVNVRVHDSDGLAIGRIDEREIDRLSFIGLERRRVRKLRQRLLASERSTPCAVIPATCRLWNGDVGLLAVDHAWLLRLEAVGDAVVARCKPNAPVAETNKKLFAREIDLALLVDRRRRKPTERRRAHGTRLRATLLYALAVHLEPNLGPVDNENAITHYFVGEKIGIEPNLVPPIWRSRRKHISLTLRRGRA